VVGRGPVQAKDARPETPEALTYRPFLDGLRAFAVYLVIAFHAHVSGFDGGFIGVDVFFVLSGYLVTMLLVRDLRSQDRVDFRGFYARRARRLLPAAAVTIVVSAVVFAAIASPAERIGAKGAIRSASL
jgi:peptidoglycan/LPS O-acetylase OafA/YrhL